uniref:FERM domain-containing protein n=1 Tax=Plectus sambesii TaxID=2011161 RepID=A0A914V145_9BILA
MRTERNADGKALFLQVVAHLNLTEKDYFALSFRDDGNRNWLYNEKRIAKQLH